MRAAALILAVGAVFAAFVVVSLRDGRRTVAREEAALRRLRGIRDAGPAAPVDEDGYRFSWVQGEDLPALVVARPLRAAGRWFAATPGGRTVYEFDTVLRHAPGGEPHLAALRRHLARPAAERPADPPGGWDPVEP